jgi:hypothetical protein
MLICACATRSPASPPPPPSPASSEADGAAPGAWLHDADAWPRLSTALVGTWRGTDGLTLESSLISRDSALVERWIAASGSETLNVFHPDGDGVVLTHYCAQGNQARLRATAATDGLFVFEQQDVTNLATGGEALCRLEVRPRGDTLSLRETYCPGDGTSSERIVHRVAP